MAVTSYWCSLFLTYTHVTMITVVHPNSHEQEQTFCVPRVYITAPATAIDASGKTQHCQIQKLCDVVSRLCCPTNCNIIHPTMPSYVFLIHFPC
jgi:formaldehyde-activating enzyme involved in methanogenesis